MYQTRVVIIDSDPNSCRRLKEQLNAAGHIVVADVGDARQGIRYIFQTQPDVIILSAAVGVQLIKLIEEHRVAPVIIICEPYPDFIAELEKSWVFGLITPDMNEVMVDCVIQLAVNNFKKLCRLEEEVRGLKKTLEERKIIEQAKGLIMEKKGCSERKAFQYLRKLSMDHCIPLAKVAQQVIKLYQK
ncbi:MAG: ANTAR domain-containing protein [Desulfotomaculum sp.]|nr:ANTAR domain-containing protein [Desulfotomaculum sp.]